MLKNNIQDLNYSKNKISHHNGNIIVMKGNKTNVTFQRSKSIA